MYSNLKSHIKTYNLFIIVVILLITIPFVSVSQNKTIEYKVKSAYLVKICKVTTWKNESYKKNKTFKIYTIGEHTKAETISIKNNISVKGRSIKIIHIDSLNDVENLDLIDVLYIYKISKHELKNILDKTKDRDILTVSDNDGFGELGVIINFFINNNNKINFEINRDAELKSKIKLKSQLYNFSGSKIIGNNYNL